MNLVELQPIDGTFTKQQLARLAAYRAAVRAGFFSDWDGSTEITDAEPMAELRRSKAAPDDALFTQAELDGLEALRERFAAGGFAQDRPAQ